MDNLKGLYIGSMILLLLGVVGGGFAAYTVGTHKEEPAAASTAENAPAAESADAAKTDAASTDTASTDTASTDTTKTDTPKTADASPAAGSKTDTTAALPAAAAAGKATAAPTGNADSGKAQFAQTCAGCHGPEAKGGVGPDLTAADGPTSWNDAQFITTLREGKTPTETLKPMMPHFTTDQISDDKIKDIHAYLVSLK